MDNHNMYITFIESELNKMNMSKVKSTNTVSGVIKILNHFLNRNSRNYVFMFPVKTKTDSAKNGSSVQLTIRDIQNDMSTCVNIDTIENKGFVVMIGSSSQFGECKRREPYKVPQTKSESMKLDVSIPLEIVSKIHSNIYKQFPIV